MYMCPSKFHCRRKWICTKYNLRLTNISQISCKYVRTEAWIYSKDGKCHICIPKNRGCKYLGKWLAFTMFATCLLLSFYIFEKIFARSKFVQIPFFGPCFILELLMKLIYMFTGSLIKLPLFISVFSFPDQLTLIV